MINPNDPEENPEMFADKPQPPPVPRAKPATQPDEPVPRRAVTPTHDHQRGGQGAGTARPVRHSVGSDHSFDRSPLHPHYQAKVVGKGGGSPVHSYDSSHGTPGRSRMKPTRGDESVSFFLRTLTFEAILRFVKLYKYFV